MIGRSSAVCFVAVVAVAECRAAEAPVVATTSAFTIEGTAAEPVKKRIAETLESRRKQLRAFWPERVAAERPIRVELWGTLDEYRTATSRRGAPIENPACYFADEGVIVLGFDGRRFDGPLRLVRDRLERLRDDLQTAERALAGQIKADDQRFALSGTPRNERKRLIGDRRRAFDVAAAKMQADINEADRENRKTLDEATDRLCAAAAHEFFHAYVDAYVYPPAQGGLPAWLNEGVAQIVEHAAASATLGRATKPDAELVKQRRDQRERGAAIGARELLSADAAKFLIHDANPSAEAGKYYLASWFVAQSLLNDGKLAPGADLDRFVADRTTAPLAAFERLVGLNVAEWERLHAK
jgi:hypothetical protein